MPHPPGHDHEQQEAQHRREEEAERTARGVERFVQRSERGAQVVETGEHHVPPALNGLGGGLQLLNGTLQFATGLDSIANGPPRDALTNNFRTVRGATNAVGGGASLIRAFLPQTLEQAAAQTVSHVEQEEAIQAAEHLEHVGRRAGHIATGLDVAANLADMHAHGATEDNVNGLVSDGVSIAAAGVEGAGAPAALVYAGAHAMGDVARDQADRAAVAEHLHPHTVAAGRGVNGGTRVDYDTGTDSASREGLHTGANWTQNHATASGVIGRFLRPDLAARRAFGGRVNDSEFVETGATAAGAVSAMGHAVANTVQGVGVAGINAAYGPQRPPGSTPWEQAFGVRSLTPYEISQLPSYDLDNPPPRSR